MNGMLTTALTIAVRSAHIVPPLVSVISRGADHKMHSQHWRLEVSRLSESEFASDQFASGRQNGAANSKI